MKDQVIEEIKRKCGKVRLLRNGWCHFVYRNLHYVSVPDKGKGMIRISIPYIGEATKNEPDDSAAVINETNREVKYVKVIILNNGCISLNYDHRVCENEQVSETVPHMIDTLYAASEYLKWKIKSKKVQ